MYRLVIFLVLLHSINSASTEAINNTQDVDMEKYTTDLINRLLPANYNKNLRPKYGGEPIRVNISLYINDISAISEASMDYKVDFFIRHFWRDHRLAFAVKHNISRLTLGEEFMKNIWKPDSYFSNGKESTVHKTVASETTTLFRIDSTGDIVYSTRISLLAQCPMDLSYFPLDQQKCSIEIANSTEVVLDWADTIAVEISPNINLPTFQLIGYNKFSVVDDYFAGNVKAQCDLFLSRSIGYYMSQVYIPSMLIVVISWMPFWLDRNDNHARVALGVTTVLTMTTLTTNNSSDFPKISHLKAIDIYLFVSFMMVFFSLIEYATVGYYENEKTRELQKKEMQKERIREVNKLQANAEQQNNVDIELDQMKAQNGFDNTNCSDECSAEKRRARSPMANRHGKTQSGTR